MTTSLKRNGYWIWDEEKDCLKFISRDETEKVIRPTKVPSVVNSSPQPVASIASKIQFREVVNKLEQIKFRRHIQRRCSLKEPDVVTIQDLKDVVLFTAHLEDLTVEFINYLHTATIDRFLRALIIYLQSYLQIYDDMLQQRKDNKRKIWQPIVEELENTARNDLADLRSMVAREYLCIISGINEMKRFYHYKRKIRTSLSDKDRKLFESLMCIATRVVWIALRRKTLPLIDIELNRILRSTHFNLAYRRHPSLQKLLHERKVLRGTSDLKQRKFLQHSPASNEILKNAHDHRMLAIGVVEIEPTDDRLQYLESAYTAPEELLPKLGVTVGILGLPRSQFNDMLKDTTETQELPPFKLPPKSIHKDETVPKEFPQKPYSKYKETEQTKVARERQRQIWEKLAHRQDLMQAIMEQSNVKLNPSKSVTTLKRSSITMRTSSVHFAVHSQDESLFSF